MSSPFTCVVRLSTIQSNNVGSSLSWIYTSACITHCESHWWLISNACPISYAFYISLEAKLFLIWDRASWSWCCCRILPSIANEDIEVRFFALGDNIDFKVCFLYQFLIPVNIFLQSSESFHQMSGVSSMLEIWRASCLHINWEGFFDLCNCISLNLKGQTRWATFMSTFGKCPMYYIFSCMFLDINF